MNNPGIKYLISSITAIFSALLAYVAVENILVVVWVFILPFAFIIFKNALDSFILKTLSFKNGINRFVLIGMAVVISILLSLLLKFAADVAGAGSVGASLSIMIIPVISYLIVREPDKLASKPVKAAN